MGKLFRSRCITLMTAAVMAVSLLWSFTLFSEETAYAEDNKNDSDPPVITEPLDLSGATGDQGDLHELGWQWEHSSKTLKLKRFDMDLSGYEGEYDAAVKLPACSDQPCTIELVYDNEYMPECSIRLSGQITENDYRVGILAPGDLNIKGKGSLFIDADKANGIQVGDDERGDLDIEGTKAENGAGLGITVSADQFGLEAGNTVTAENCTLNMTTENEAEMAEVMGGIVGQRGVKISNAALGFEIAGFDCSGVTSWYGDVKLDNVHISQSQPEKAASKVSGISCVNAWDGDAILKDTVIRDVEIGNNESDASYIVSAGESAVCEKKYHVMLDGCYISGHSEGYGIDAKFAGLTVNDSELDIESHFTAVRVGVFDPLIIRDSKAFLKCSGFMGSAISAENAVTVRDSQLDLTADTEIGSAFFAMDYQDKGNVIFRGAKTDIKARAKKEPAFQLYFVRDNTAPAAAPFRLYDGLRAVTGGKLQRIDYFDDGKARAWSYTVTKLGSKDGAITGASGSVRICFSKNTAETARSAAKKNSAVIRWKKVNGAGRYKVYFARCGGTLKAVKTAGSAARSFTKKDLKKNRVYKFRVEAQKKDNGAF